MAGAVRRPCRHARSGPTGGAQTFAVAIARRPAVASDVKARRAGQRLGSCQYFSRRINLAPRAFR